MGARVLDEVDRMALARRPSFADAARPGDVGGDGAALVLGEERLHVVVGEHGEDRLLVDRLAPEGVHDGDRARADGLQQRLQLVHLLEELVREEALVHDVDRRVLVPQPPALEHEVARVAHQCRIALALEELAEEVMLAPGGHLLVVHDRDGRMLLAAPRLAMAGHERLQQALARPEPAQLPAPLEALHHRQLQEDVDEHLVVGNAGRALRVQLDEAVGVGGDERVQTRRRRGPPVAGIDADQLPLLRRDVHAVPQLLAQLRLDLLHRPEDVPADGADGLVVGRRDEVGTGEGAEHAAAEGEARLPHALQEARFELLHQSFVVAEEAVVVLGGTRGEGIHDQIVPAGPGRLAPRLL